MHRLRTLSVLLLVLFVAAPAALADGKIATDEEAKAALEVFKAEYKAKGLKGDDKLMQRDYAIKNLVKLQHELIVKEIGKIAKVKDPDLSTLAVIYLAEQRDLAGLVGPKVVDAMKRKKKDPIFLMTALDTLGYVRYLGAGETITDLLKHKDFSVKKYAIRTAGWTQDIRLMGPLLKLLGINEKNEKQGKKEDKADKKSGGKEEVEEGYSWEGTEVNYDTGTPGDHDQKMAEKIGKAEQAKKKAEAQAKAGKKGGGGPSVSGGSSSGPRGGSSRSLEELIPTILKALKSMTGEEFDSPKDIRLWLRVNKDKINALKDRFKRREKEQKEGKKVS